MIIAILLVGWFLCAVANISLLGGCPFLRAVIRHPEVQLVCVLYGPVLTIPLLIAFALVRYMGGDPAL